MLNSISGGVPAAGSMLWIEFVEFKGVDRASLRMRIQDRGAALVADPNNFFLTPYAPCDGCAPGLEPVRSTK